MNFLKIAVVALSMVSPALGEESISIEKPEGYTDQEQYYLDLYGEYLTCMKVTNNYKFCLAVFTGAAVKAD